MAQRTYVQFTDDLDGSEAAGSVTFGLDGDAYEIDLSEPNAERLREALSPFVAAARKLPKTGPRSAGPVGATQRSGGTGAPRGNTDAADARRWAQDNGISVPERGRVPGLVMEAYKAHKRNDDETLNRILGDIDKRKVS